MDAPLAEDIPTSTKFDLTATRASIALPTVSVRAHKSGVWMVFVVDGEMDFQVIPLLVDLPGSGAKCAVFDLHGVTFMDAGGLSAILGSHRKALQSGGCVRLVTPSTTVRKILRLTGTTQVWRVFDSLDTAVSTPMDIRPILAS